MNLKGVPVKGPIRATVRDPQGYCSTIRNWKRFFGGSSYDYSRIYPQTLF